MQTVACESLRLRLHIVEMREGHACELHESINLQATRRDSFNVDYTGDFTPGDASLRTVIASVVIEADRTWFPSDGQLVQL